MSNNDSNNNYNTNLTDRFYDMLEKQVKDIEKMFQLYNNKSSKVNN